MSQCTSSRIRRFSNRGVDRVCELISDPTPALGADKEEDDVGVALDRAPAEVKKLGWATWGVSVERDRSGASCGRVESGTSGGVEEWRRGGGDCGVFGEISWLCEH